ncbi:MAG: ATP-dependent Clp protease adaptor ClpS [Candidatus Cloacimonadota bacterium]|nr:MAG: ATP-dependent Clp protease adaptor ClpS [Candidatus Cloacimonadota bacterium]PIE79229.1 MAG: ATP-dependent Clp protease adaptor ClpS [Candidatus Delongbacteria bacterium]
MSDKFGYQSDTDNREEVEEFEPEEYRVILLNDDYTTMEFVIAVLEKIFRKTTIESQRIMMSVHQNGSGVCGVYVKEIAETKVAQTLDLAKKNGFPLRVTMEKI